MRHLRAAFLPLSLLTAFAAENAPAPAASSSQAPAVAAAPKPLKIGKVVVQGNLRSRVEAWDWFKADSGDNAYAFNGNLLRLSFSQQMEHSDWQVELAVPTLFGLPANAVAAGTQGALGLGANYFTANDRQRNVVGFFPKQAFFRWKFKNQSLRLGRFEFNDGTEMTPKNAVLAALKNTRINQRILGGFGWTHVGRSFDGAHYTLNTKGSNLTLIGAVPTRGVFQTDGWGWNQVAFGYGAWTKPYSKGRVSSESRLFSVYYDDFRGASVLKTDNRAVALRRGETAGIKIGTFGGHSLHAITAKPGTFDLVFWGAAQTGKWGVQTHAASAVLAEAGFQPAPVTAFAKKLKPWFRAGFYNGSGDGNAADGRHGSFFQIMPTPRPFARMPFFDMINNRDVMASVVLRPHAKVTWSSEYHRLSLASSNDLWYVGGGVFQPWSFGYVGRPSNGNSGLANFYDTSFEYRWKPAVTFLGYYGYALGDDVARSIYPRGKNGSFGYVEVAYKF